MRYQTVSLALLLFFPALSFATWQLGGSPVRTPNGKPNNIVLDTPVLYQTNPPYIIVTQKGLLLTNVQDYAAKCGWDLVWMAKRDYPLNIISKISGPSFDVTLNRLLEHYPLVASYNSTEHIVTVSLRTWQPHQTRLPGAG